MSEAPSRPATADEIAGMAWWNALSEVQRRFWFARANTAIVAEAWVEYKQAVPGQSESSRAPEA
jgi:hypothetical protein